MTGTSANFAPCRRRHATDCSANLARAASTLYSRAPRPYARSLQAAGSPATTPAGRATARSPAPASRLPSSSPASGGVPVKRNLHAGRPSSGGLSLTVFTEAELDDIHLGSLEILERTGVWVEADDALDIFSDGGCRVDRETRMVRIPPHLVEDALRSAPPKSYLCGRDPGAGHRPGGGSRLLLQLRRGHHDRRRRAPASTATRCSRTCTRRRAWSTPSATSTPTSRRCTRATCPRRRPASTSGRRRS